MIDSIAVVGDAGDMNCWSGTPWHFSQAARSRGFPANPWRLDLAKFSRPRQLWTVGQMARGRGMGGYQYSDAFLDRAESAIPSAAFSGKILTFNQHFPRGRTVAKTQGRLWHYLDATFATFCTPGGLAEKLPLRVSEKARQAERENYRTSQKIVTMARWAAESVVRDCGINPDKVTTILPGANLTLPNEFSFPSSVDQPGRARPLVLGFVGKDWRRKGLPFLLLVRKELERMGLPAIVRCAGNCPDDLVRQPGLEFVGFIDKAKEPKRFLNFLTRCDVGCLFSLREPLGLSTLEFLRAGVPVAGFIVEGIADTIPPDAGFRFATSATVSEVAQTLWTTFRDPDATNALRLNARAWSPFLTWERCAAEWEELLTTGTIKDPVQPWRGLRAFQT